MNGDRAGLPGGIDEVLARMRETLQPLESTGNPLRYFLATYSRTTRAVGEAIADGGFEDGEWVQRWDVAFADLYLDALDRYRSDPANPPWPWRLAFGARPDLPPLGHVLLGINAHINYDLPQALLAVISAEDFARPQVLAARERDHRAIDDVLSARVSDEDRVLKAQSGPLALLDRAMAPLNRAASRRFLREAREKVWHNTRQLQTARMAGPDAYRQRLEHLEVLSAARISDLLRPGQVLVRLAVAGFGVTLPPL
jgi:Family of unknown function (DUF5995)